jgi:hypothetical protein
VVPASSTRAPWKPSARRLGLRRTVERMGDTGQRECVGRDDGTQCRNPGVVQVLPGHWVCEECLEHVGLDHLVPGRGGSDDGLTRPVGDPGEVGKEDAA